MRRCEDGEEVCLQMRRIFIFFLIAISHAVFAVAGWGGEGAPEFRLLGAGGDPIAFARVSLLGRGDSVFTDRDGRFRLDQIPGTPFDLAVTSDRGAWLGLVRVESVVAGINELRLASEREELTVLAPIAPSTLAPPAAAPTILTRREIEERRPVRLADALEDIPGTGRIEEGQSVVPSIRGLARSRTLLLIDDARVTAERRAGTSAGYLDPFSVENIEVVRGPGSVAYGSDALGGVLHARTPQPRPGDLGGRFEVGGAVGAPAATGGIELNVPVGGGAILAQAHQRWFGDYESPGGTIPNSAARDRGLLLRGVLPIGRGRFFAGLQVDRGGDVGKPATDSSITRAYYPDERSNRFTVGADLGGALGFTSFELRGFAGSYQLITNRDTFPTGLAPGRLAQSDVSASDASFRMLARRPAGRGGLRVGVDVNGRYGLAAENRFVDYVRPGSPLATAVEVAIDAARRVDVGVFAETEQALAGSWLTGAFGIRGDRVTTRNRGGFFGERSTSEGAASGFAAVTIVPRTDVSFTLQYSHGFRDPLLSDRYFRGVSGRGFVVGNPLLDPETTHQFDLALRAKHGALQVAVYGFIYRIDDLIERFRSGSDFNFRNSGTADIRGAEMESNLEVGRGFTARLSLGVTRGRLLADASPVADIPPASAVLTLDQRLNDRFWWRLRVAAYGRDSSPGPTEKTTPGCGVADASAGLKLWSGLEARLSLRNIFDKQYPATSDEAAVDAPGRNATLVIGGSF